MERITNEERGMEKSMAHEALRRQRSSLEAAMGEQGVELSEALRALLKGETPVSL